ncbi:MAG: transcriptional regulator, partial [Bryobacterales bacterium]|nr:transcriptional regulator [Bryobacterales bacterium]
VLGHEPAEQSSVVVVTEHFFVEHGPGVFTLDITRRIRSGRTALIHCFTSKEALMVAEIGKQFLDQATERSTFVHELRETLAVLDRASTRWEKSESLIGEAFRRASGWLQCAEKEDRTLKRCLETFTSTTPEDLHRWASTVRLCGAPTSSAEGERDVERFVDPLWNGGKP